MIESLTSLLEQALAARLGLFDETHRNAFRLFNGFSEGCPELVLDLYGTTAVLHDYSEEPDRTRPELQEVKTFLQDRLPWLRAAVLKVRNGGEEEKRGALLFGGPLDDRIREHGVWYALDLTMNRDASLYLDTRELRRWAIHNLQGRTVLNTFAYTGSLGVAAWAGRAARVVQLDLNRRFLNLAKTSYTLNGFPIRKADFLVGDFFVQVGRLKRAGACFDCVILDPPFFSSTPGGTVDLAESARLVNKVRPLVRDGGRLVAINNALYVSGKAYMDSLETLCADGYLKIAELIPVPQDFIGYPRAGSKATVTDPAPFNHSTKIAVLDVRRKRS